MHKSINIINTFAIALSIIMLAVPFSSMKLFSNASSQEYGYSDDPYKSTDNSYGRSYSYPENQLSYNEVNNIKRISYNYNKIIDNPIYTESAKFLDKDTIIIAEDPFYQSINGTVTSTRILNVEGIPQTEVSFFENAMINGNITVLNQGTFLESIHLNKIIGKGKGIITSSDGQGVTYNAEDIGKVTRNGSIIYQGFIYFDTTSNGSLSFLKDSVGLYVSIVGGEASQRNIWQWTVK